MEDRGDASLVAPFAAVAAREPGSNFARWLATKLTQLAPILAARAPLPLGNHPAWSTIREYYIHGYAKETARPLAAMLDKHGATPSTSRFMRGLE